MEGVKMRNDKTSIPVYNVFGLTVQCELPAAPLFGMIHTTDVVPDVTIRVVSIIRELDHPVYRDQFISAVPGCILLKIKGIAKYLICNGKEILIQPEADAKQGDVATFAFGSALGTLLYQRGILAYHGSAVRTSKGAVIFSGEKGAGKSTTAASLSTKGWEFMSDDVCAVHLEKDKPVLYPGLSSAKLASDSYSSIFTKAPEEDPVSPILNKYRVPFHTNRESSPVSAICILETTPGKSYIEPVTGTERLSIVMKHVYRPLMHQLVETPVQRYKQYTLLSSQVAVFRIFRSLDFLKMDELLQLLEEKVLT